MTELPKVSDFRSMTDPNSAYTLFTQLLPLLLRALDLPELDLRANVVDTLALLVKDTPEAIKGHAESIVSTLLRMASYEKGTIDSEASAVSTLSTTRGKGLC